MATFAFDSAKEGFLDGSLDWDTGTQKASLVRGYNASTSHKFLTDVTSNGGTIVSTVTLSGKTVTGGRAGCANPVFPTVTAGAAIQSVIIYQSSAAGGGADLATSAQRLIAHFDSAGANGLPVTPNGLNIPVTVDPGVNGLFRL
jgi:hypothetical protein